MFSSRFVQNGRVSHFLIKLDQTEFNRKKSNWQLYNRTNPVNSKDYLIHFQFVKNTRTHTHVRCKQKLIFQVKQIKLICIWLGHSLCENNLNHFILMNHRVRDKKMFRRECEVPTHKKSKWKITWNDVHRTRKWHSIVNGECVLSLILIILLNYLFLESEKLFHHRSHQ